jgi:hypothetical protein
VRALPGTAGSLREALTIWSAPHDEDGDIRSKVRATGIWGGTITTERDAVSHLPLEEAVEILEAELPQRVAGHVAAFHAADYAADGSAATKIRRIRRILTTEAAREAGNGSRTSIKRRRKPVEPSRTSSEV